MQRSLYAGCLVVALTMVGCEKPEPAKVEVPAKVETPSMIGPDAPAPLIDPSPIPSLPPTAKAPTQMPTDPKPADPKMETPKPK